MAYKSTVICDRCKREETCNGQYFTIHAQGWQEVKFEIGQYEHKTYLFCPECRKTLGLYKEENPKENVKINSIEQRLFDCISDIVAGQMPEA